MHDEPISPAEVVKQGIMTQEDWNVCDNPVRPWYNIPFQTYEVLAGRELRSHTGKVGQGSREARELA